MWHLNTMMNKHSLTRKVKSRTFIGDLVTNINKHSQQKGKINERRNSR